MPLGRRGRTETGVWRVLMPGEAKVLAYLHERRWATVGDVAGACLPGAPRESVERLVSNLDWLGYVTRYPGPGGTAATLQITAQGAAAVGGRATVCVDR
jgi:hypothetical protein